jgi:hypothetical protein
MGTLDDAIREHLELKKRSGAADEDIKRLESEAFGPVRREPAGETAGAAPAAVPEPETDAGLADEDLPPQEPPAFDPEPEPRAAEAEVEPVAPPPVAPPPAEPADAVAPAEPRRAEREPEKPWLEDDEFDDGPQPTAEFTAADVAEAAGDASSEDYVAPDEEGEDLLEETPDFLQETPEHDRLWFEQRPPRDFDFDQ